MVRENREKELDARPDAQKGKIEGRGALKRAEKTDVLMSEGGRKREGKKADVEYIHVTVCMHVLSEQLS